MSVMASARDLITLFVALETISIPTFILAAFRKHDRESNEAGVKYYLIGVLSSALMLYGMSLIFGITGSTKLSDISAYVSARTAPRRCSTVAIFLSLVGFAFKVSAVPFHFWAPDTYEGAPTPVTAFLSVASKAGGFGLRSAGGCTPDSTACPSMANDAAAEYRAVARRSACGLDARGSRRRGGAMERLAGQISGEH